MILAFRLVFFLSFLNCIFGSNKLLFILVDGLRWDYLHAPNLGGFEKMLQNGVRADFLRPVWPSSSFPNYYSILTGLYPESNGFLSNYMYDAGENQTFELETQTSDLDGFWYKQGEALWVTAKKQDKNSFWYLFPMATADFGVYSPGNVPYDSSLTGSEIYLKQYLSQALDKLEGSMHLAGVYYENLDFNGHLYGPQSSEVKRAMVGLDKVVDWLQEEMDRRHLAERVNVIILSDHGMVEIDISRIINMTHYVSDKELKVTLNSGAVVSVWPMEEKTEQVYHQLKNAHPNLTVYRKHEIPDRFHFRNNERAPPIVLLADEGWFIATTNHGFYKHDGMYAHGAHGYDNEIHDVRGVFTARGPDFRTNFRAKDFPNVDVYQMMCKILDIRPAPNNGTWDHVSSMMANHDTSSARMCFSSFFQICFIHLLICFVFF